jgi:hypothetical protein
LSLCGLGEGLAGVIGVELIGQIRRAFFEHRRAIKEISRDLQVSRATVRKVVRSGRTTFKYAREVQPSPKLGEWMGPLTEIVEAEARLPKRERRSTQRLFEELRGRGYDGAHDSVQGPSPRGYSIGHALVQRLRAGLLPQSGLITCRARARRGL